MSLLEIAELLSKGGGGGAGGEEQKPPPRIRAHGTLVDHHAAASLPKGGLAAARAAPLRFGGSARGGSGFFAQPSCEKGTQRPLELRGIRGAVADASAPPCFWLVTRRGWYRVLGAAPEYSETFEKDVRALRLAAAAARLADEEAARAEGGGGGSVLRAEGEEEAEHESNGVGGVGGNVGGKGAAATTATTLSALSRVREAAASALRRDSEKDLRALEDGDEDGDPYREIGGGGGEEDSEVEVEAAAAAAKAGDEGQRQRLLLLCRLCPPLSRCRR